MCIPSFIGGIVFAYIFALAVIWRFVARESERQMESHRHNQSHNWGRP
jgi:hypothetical protein